MAFDAERLAATLSEIDGQWRQAQLCVALSGGMDSTVLLHAMSALARDGGVALRALHVDHGLEPASAAWAEHCRRLCGAYHVPLEMKALALTPPPGASLEATAREARYAVLAQNLAPEEWLLTAHHRDDQLETVLIQLLRGAGVAGLAAMPRRARLGAGWHVRPLLDVDRDCLARYAAAHALAWIEDPTNLAERFDRGWLRSRVLPAIRARWPAAAATVARSASHLAQASRVLSELAESDARDVLDSGRLSISALARLSQDRQINLLRWWLRREGLRPPAAVRLSSALPSLFTPRQDAQPTLRWEGGELRRYRGRLYALAFLPAQPPAAEVDAGDFLDLGPGLGRFGLLAGDEGGLPPAARAAIRFRGGGESLKPHPARPRKRLKDLCQEAGIVPWMRDCLPLVYVADRLAAVGDLWLDADLAVPPGQPSLKPVWSGRPQLF